ncbi:TPA: hypothetical protein ACJTDP_001701 [Yersinia enterocolitica]
MDVLYRSDKCQREDYDSTTESHIRKERGFNPRVERMTQQGRGDIWEARIALDGGGKCEWQLSTVRVDIRLVANTPLTEGKNITSASYVFGFDDDAYSGGGGVGRKRDAYGDLHLKTDFFPMIFINHVFNEMDIDMFGGNTDYEKWSRYYRIYNGKKIFIEPNLHINKIVVLESPVSPPGNITATYPDGSKEEIPHINPDYEKLLSMK